MSRKKVLFAVGGLIVLTAFAYVYFVLHAQPTNLARLKPYMVRESSVIMRNHRQLVVVGSHVTPATNAYVHFSEIELEGLSVSEAVDLVKRDCSPSKGWILSRHASGRNYNLRNGASTITFVAGGRLFNNPNATVSILETTPVSKSEETIISLLSKVGVRLAR